MAVKERMEKNEERKKAFREKVAWISQRRQLDHSSAERSVLGGQQRDAEKCSTGQTSS